LACFHNYGQYHYHFRRAGYLIYLSDSLKIPRQSIEPDEAAEYAYLLSKHTFDWVVLMYLCRQIDQQQRFAAIKQTTDTQFERNMQYFLEQLKAKGIPLTSGQLNFNYWAGKYAMLLHKDLSWRTFNANEYYPNYSITPMNEVNRSSDFFRNEYMVNTIFTALQQHHKVMVVVGGGHLIVQKQLIKHTFKKAFH